MSVEELQKAIAEINKKTENTQEQPSQNPIATSGQPQEKQAQDASSKVDSIVTKTSPIEEQEKEKTRKRDTSTPIEKSQGANPLITIIDQGRTEEDKEEEKIPRRERIRGNINSGQFSYYRDSY